MVLKNAQVEDIEASAGVYRHSITLAGEHCFEFRSDDTALVYGGDGILKKDFQSVHNGKASPEVDVRVVNAFGASSVDEFRETCFTVGVGTNVIIKDAEGSIQIPMVFRTSYGPDGTPNLGKVSRAAGGAYGNMAVSGLREMSEELICSVNKDGDGVTVFQFVYEDSNITAKDQVAIRQRFRDRASSILEEHGIGIDNVVFRDLDAQILSVPGFTEGVVQVVNGEKSVLENRFITTPVGGDYNIDTIIYCELPADVSLSSLSVVDGEANFDGDLLKRSWQLKSPEEWIKMREQGQEMSQGPENFFDNYDLIQDALP